MPLRPPAAIARPMLGLLLSVLCAAGSHAEPRRPTRDDEVLQVLPQATGAAAAAQALRRDLARDPRNPELALRVVRLQLARLAAEGDPRDAGLARAALAPWWSDPAPPPDLRVARAVLRQFGHDFDGARADLQAVVAARPDHTEAWAWLLAIEMVQARYDAARAACQHLQPLVDELLARACEAQVDAATGRARQAAQALSTALEGAPGAPPDLRLWVTVRLAETRERLSDWAGAESAYRAALALGLEDTYLRAAHADFLLDRGRAAEVLTLLQGREANDLMLLRLAIAGRALKHERAAAWQTALAARFDAARQRGDTAHQKEEARFALEVLDDARRALPLAAANWQLQREVADARVLLQAAVAARDKAAAAPVLAWLRDSRIESPVLQALAAKVQALP